MSYRLDRYLFTHAGVLNEWLKLINGDTKIGDSTYAELMEFPQYLVTVDNLDDLLQIPYGLDMLFMVSTERGGDFTYGSCLWADIHEHLYPIKEGRVNEIYQIFGHTMTYPEIYTEYIGPNFAMLDAQHCFTLDLDSGEFIKEDN